MGGSLCCFLRRPPRPAWRQQFPLPPWQRELHSSLWQRQECQQHSPVPWLRSPLQNPSYAQSYGSGMNVGFFCVLAGQQFDPEGSKQGSACKAGQFAINTHGNPSFPLLSLVACHHDHDHTDDGPPGPKSMLLHWRHSFCSRLLWNISSL